MRRWRLICSDTLVFRYARTDEDVVSGTPLSRIVRRELASCVSSMILSFRAGVGVSRIKVPYWIFRCFLGKVARPLNSTDTIQAVLRVAGKPVPILLRKSQSDLQVLQEVFLQKIYDFPYEPFGGDVTRVIDLGSNIGLYAALCQARFPNARILCVEPVEENVEVIRRNDALSRGVWDVECAAISGADEVEFFVSEWWSSGTALSHIGRRRLLGPNRLESRLALPNRTVPGVTMDTLMEAHGYSYANIVKVDIEGAEEELILSGGPWLDRVDLLVVEIHEKYVDGAAIRDALFNRGFVARELPGPCEVFVREGIARYQQEDA